MIDQSCSLLCAFVMLSSDRELNKFARALSDGRGETVDAAVNSALKAGYASASFQVYVSLVFGAG